MRLIIMYDLDVSDEVRRKEYTRFHKWIIERGFFMMQYSIYVKVVNAATKAHYEISAIKKKVPTNGNVRILVITDQQYNNMHFLRGGKRINESINTEQRRIKIDFERDETRD